MATGFPITISDNSSSTDISTTARLDSAGRYVLAGTTTTRASLGVLVTRVDQYGVVEKKSYIEPSGRKLLPVDVGFDPAGNTFVLCKLTNEEVPGSLIYTKILKFDPTLTSVTVSADYTRANHDTTPVAMVVGTTGPNIGAFWITGKVNNSSNTPNTGEDIFVAKFSASSLNLAWAADYTGTGPLLTSGTGNNDYPVGLAFDSSERLLIGGITTSTTSLSGPATHPSVLKLNKNNGNLFFLRRFQSSVSDNYCSSGVSDFDFHADVAWICGRTRANLLPTDYCYHQLGFASGGTGNKYNPEGITPWGGAGNGDSSLTITAYPAGIYAYGYRLYTVSGNPTIQREPIVTNAATTDIVFSGRPDSSKFIELPYLEPANISGAVTPSGSNYLAVSGLGASDITTKRLYPTQWMSTYTAGMDRKFTTNAMAPDGSIWVAGSVLTSTGAWDLLILRYMPTP